MLISVRFDEGVDLQHLSLDESVERLNVEKHELVKLFLLDEHCFFDSNSYKRARLLRDELVKLGNHLLCDNRATFDTLSDINDELQVSVDLLKFIKSSLMSQLRIVLFVRRRWQGIDHLLI